MGFINPNKGRAIFKENRHEIIITIPSKKNYFIILFMLFWLGGWLMGEIFTIGAFILGKTPIEAKIFSIFWLGGWTVGGTLMIITVLWFMFGKEIVNIDKKTVKIEKKVIFFKITKEYGVEYIKNLRIGNTNNSFFVKNRSQMIGLNEGNIHFDYGMKTIKFGLEIEEAESKYIIDKINEIWNINS